MAPLRELILATLVYHDILNYPMTAWEIFRLQLQPEAQSVKCKVQSYGEVLAEMETLKRDNVVGERNGFYMLKGREGLYEDRILQTKIAEEKWHRVRGAISLLRHVPFVRALALAGSIAMGAAKRGSDIDLFVIAEKNHIWTARFFLTVFAMLSGKLRSGRITKLFFPFVRGVREGASVDKLCVNHYVATDALLLKNQSLFTASEYARLVPLWGAEVFEKFFKANEWIQGYFPNLVIAAENRKAEQFSRSSIQRFFEPPFFRICGVMAEKLLRALQLAFIRKNPLTELGGRIVADDHELAFHPETPEPKILDKFGKKMVELGVLN